MMQNGKTKARSGSGQKSVTTKTPARIRKLAFRDINRKIWHNWLAEENPFFQATAPTALGAPGLSSIPELEVGRERDVRKMNNRKR
jgi:hypothetical protein